MELHRNTGRELRLGIGMTGIGVLGAALPGLLSLVGWRFFLGPWFWYLAGGLVAIVGVYQLYSALSPFRLVLHEQGITVRTAGLNTTVPWQSIAAITVERLSYINPPGAPHLVLWPAQGVNLGVKTHYQRGGAAGLPLVQLDQLTESEAEVVAALGRFAGTRFMRA